MENSITIPRHSSAYWILHDAGILIVRSLKHIFRNMDQLLGLAIQPIMFMLLFRYVFGGSINTGNISYVDFLTAGIVVQNAAFGALTTSMSVNADLSRGIMDRFRSLPMSNAVVMLGHVTADLVRNVISSTIMILVALLIGFRPVAGVGDWLMILGILLLFTFAISWIAAIMGLLAKSMEAVQWMGFMAVFPLTFASAAFAPTDNMPTGIRIFAENQPVTHVIEAIRALMVGTPIGNHGTLAVIWCIGIIAIAIPLAAYMFRTRGRA